VEHLIERDVTEKFLLHKVNFPLNFLMASSNVGNLQIHHISQSDYQDVVEERAIIKLCGYPVCQNDLGPMPNKRFHISTATNKVYDITERKVNFCTQVKHNNCHFLHMVMTRFSDENVFFEQQQKSRYLVSNKSSDRHIGFPV